MAHKKEKFYKLRVLKGAKFSKLMDIVNDVYDRYGKDMGMSKLAIIKDIIHCSKKFGSGYYDYIVYHFFELDDAQRATYMTRIKYKKMLEYMNDEDAGNDIFNDKAVFNEKFKDFVARDFFGQDATLKEVTEFFEKHNKGFGKMNLSCGDGAEIIDKNNFESAEALFNYVKQQNFAVVEEYLENHPDIQKVYPPALNTMRMITVIDDEGKANLFFAAHKFGLDGRFVDVFGMHSPVNLETGIIEFPFHSGATEKDILYTVHPYTGYELLNFKVPMFQEAKEMITKAALVVPEVRYVGWDVAITPNGPVIIEGNEYTAYDFMQLPGQNPSNIGIIPGLVKLVPSLAPILQW